LACLISVKLFLPSKKNSRDATKMSVVQQDGAKSHIKEQDPAFLAAGSTGNWEIVLETQPARSPDVNHLDLSFFRALQSAQWARGFASNVDELIAMVEGACWDFEAIQIEKQ
jgi:hypothetical protein